MPWSCPTSPIRGMSERCKFTDCVSSAMIEYVKAPPYRIAIVEDDDAIRSHLADIIRSDDRFSLVASADSLQGGLNCLHQLPVDVLLVDLGLPDGSGIELIRRTRQWQNNIECMVITIHADQYHLMQALEAGATGYLLKDAMPEDICSTIVDLIHGGSPISPMIARSLLKRFRTGEAGEPLIEPLTSRELDVLKGMSVGLTRKEIAEKLSISVHTVHSHVKHIYEKLAVNSGLGAVRKAQQLHLLHGSDQ